MRNHQTKEGACEMDRKPIWQSLAIIVVAVLFVVGSAAPVEAKKGGRSIAGSYWALLDLGALGDPRIEALGVILDQNGSVLFTSEHEADKESPGVGAWRHLPGGKIGMGAASFRFGPNPIDSVCALVLVTSPPDNCVLKVGGTLSRDGNGGLEGDLFLTVENLDGSEVLTIPAPLPITMERLRPSDFPGALGELP